MMRKVMLRPALPRLYDSSDDAGFDAEDGEPLDEEAITARSEDVSSRIRSFFCEIADELEIGFEDTQPFLRSGSA